MVTAILPAILVAVDVGLTCECALMKMWLESKPTEKTKLLQDMATIIITLNQICL